MTTATMPDETLVEQHTKRARTTVAAMLAANLKPWHAMVMVPPRPVRAPSPTFSRSVLNQACPRPVMGAISIGGL